MPDDVAPSRAAAASEGALVFAGWWVVAGAFGVMCIGFGAAYTFGTVVEALQGEFQVSRGAASLVFSLAGGLYFLLGAVSGPLADRIEPRAVCLAGMLIVAIWLFLASRSETILGVYAAYGLGIGVGVDLAYASAIGAVQPWFGRRRGLASGIAVSGIGIGTLVAPPLAARLVDLEGWRGAYAVLAVIVLVLGSGAALAIRGRPQRYGLAAEPGGPASTATDGQTLAEAVRTRLSGCSMRPLSPPRSASSSVAVGTLLGPTLAGYAFDWTHSYTLPIAVGATLTLLAGAGAWSIGEPTRSK